MQDDDLTEAVKQAAREALAAKREAGGWPAWAAAIRTGAEDHKLGVQNAIMGALAAVPVVRQMVRAETPEDGAWLIYYDDADMPPDIFTGHGARDAALKTFGVKLGAWNCHLFQCVSSGQPGCPVRDRATALTNDALRALAAERTALRQKVAVLIADGLVMQSERDAAIARAEAAERERDALLEVARAARAVLQLAARNTAGGALYDDERLVPAAALAELRAALDALPPEVRAKLDPGAPHEA